MEVIFQAMPEKENLRVAAYCRVSSHNEEQLSSLVAQQEYYAAYISKHPKWTNAGIFYDIGSGLKISKRKGFQNMMAACRLGKVDLILVKSISRFARNTVDLLEATRELSALGVDVWFESNEIRLRDKKSEMIISVVAAFNQNESLNHSENIKWGIHRCFETGSNSFTGRRCFGYAKGVDGVLVIEEDEAWVVEMIFDSYLSGKSLRTISGELWLREIPSPRGHREWGIETISKLLSNEKYTGNVLLQKTFVRDYLKGTQEKNTGQCNQYFISGCHPAIIPQEIFDRVQIEKAKRGKK
jgi:DNA invertase Pin-like site-specific DNA recombinase